ncbi:MAG: hypothetical protein RIA64_12105 [Rhodospirillales bacterium]
MGSTEHRPQLPLPPTDTATSDLPGNGLTGIGGTDGYGGFGKSFLNDSVGRGQANRPGDVFRASSFLAENGLLPKSRRDADEPFLRGIEKAQEKLNALSGGGLYIDGMVKPWGPTELLSQRAINSGKMIAPSLDDFDWVASGQIPPVTPIQSVGRKVPFSDKTPEISPASVATRYPVLKDSEARTNAILQNANARFDVKENPNADDSDPWYAVPNVGKTAVLNYESILNTEARKQGVDPDLIKAIVYAENARGHYFGTAKMLEGFKLAGTIFPMNIDPEKWASLGIDKNSAYIPKTNIKAGVTLIKRIFDRITDPSPAKIASVWNFMGRENVNDFGAYVGRIYREKPWTR